VMRKYRSPTSSSDAFIGRHWMYNLQNRTEQMQNYRTMSAAVSGLSSVRDIFMSQQVVQQFLAHPRSSHEVGAPNTHLPPRNTCRVVSTHDKVPSYSPCSYAQVFRPSEVLKYCHTPQERYFIHAPQLLSARRSMSKFNVEQ
jgi:hypothetical protein